MVKMIDDLLDRDSTSNFFYLLAGLLILLSILFIMGEDEGLPFYIGRFISFVIVVLFAYNLIDWTSNITEKSEEWTEKEVLDEDINLRIKDISELIKRASEGQNVSQDILHNKLKKIFFLKLKEVEDISDNELNELVRKPDEFRKVVQDEVIADFILSMEKDSGETKNGKVKFLSSSKRDWEKDYKKKIKDIIQRIDEWEERYHG